MTNKILVVDDEPDLEELMRQRFRRRIRAGELELYFARNGVEALAQLQTVPGIELVLTDLRMPEMDGITLLGELQSFGPALRTVVISAYGDMANLRAAMRGGAFDFLPKPIDFGDLDVTIARGLEQLARQRRAERDLEPWAEQRVLANDLQRAIIDHALVARSAYGVSARLIPAQRIGGDFYDVFFIDDRRLGLLIGDVSGKGVAAAVFMKLTHFLVCHLAQHDLAVGSCLEQVSQRLWTGNEAAMFAAVFYAILDLRDGTLSYAHAGHPPPYRIGADGSVSELDGHGGIVLGVTEGAIYQSHHVTLHPGETLLLHTDGITAATDSIGIPFGRERLKRVLESQQNQGPGGIVEALVSAVQEFTGGEPLNDDLALLAVRFEGSERTAEGNSPHTDNA